MEQIEQTYTWEDFKKEKEYSRLLEFFQAFMESDSTIIFVSRKSYCLFLLLREKNVIKVGNNPIYADRLIMKSYNPDKYKGETVYLVDDTISTGNHLASVCKDVLERTRYNNIILKVFAKEKGFQDGAYIRKHFPEYEGRITLEIMETMEASEKLRFSSIETLLYHQESIPYLIELPYLAEKNTTKDYIVLQENEYEKLTEGNENWKFLKCDQAGYRQNLIEDAVIIMKNGFHDAFPEFIYDFVIRVQIVTHKDRTRSVVLSPFAILKSVKFEELEEYFFNIYGKTRYADELKNQKEILRENYARYHYKTLYRAIVYAFSYYIGIRFIDYLKSDIPDKDITFQKRNNCFCYEDEFLTAIDDIFKTGTKDFFLSAYLYRGFSSVEKRSNLLPFIGKYGRLENSERTVFHYLLALFNDLRENPIAEYAQEEQVLQKFLSIEELQEAVSLSCFEQNDEMKDILTGCLNSQLEQSKIANEFTYDEQKKVVYRGFKYAENSEAVFDVPEKVFYAAASSYLAKVHEEGYEAQYERFLAILKEFLVHNNLFGSVITSDEFQIYSELYRKQPHKDKSIQIKRLEFLIENNKNYYIEALIHYIENVDWIDL